MKLGERREGSITRLVLGSLITASTAAAEAAAASVVLCEGADTGVGDATAGLSPVDITLSVFLTVAVDEVDSDGAASAAGVTSIGATVEAA